MPPRHEELLAILRAMPADEQRRFFAVLLDPACLADSSDQQLRAELAEREKIEHALLSSERQLADANHMLRLVLDTIPVRVFWKDLDSRFLGANQRFADDAQVTSPDELVGRTDHELIWAAQAERYQRDDRRIVASGEKEVEYEEAQSAPDGSLRWLRTTKVPLRSPSGAIIGVLGTYNDVTERRRLQSRLHEAAHLEAVAQLAGGIAHDFNNLLTGILGNAEFIRDETSVDADITDSATQILRAARRAADLTQQLLAFARRGRLQTQPVDLHELLTQTAKLTSHASDQRVRVELNLEAPRSIVVGDPLQLGNAFVDLAHNARDAMPTGGVLRFMTRERTLDAAAAGAIATELKAGTYVEIQVQDSGVGIPPGVLSRVFEPFFTTKPPGTATGLGLAAVFGCMKSHGGHVTVVSEAGVGTTFTLLLPIGAGPVRRSTPFSVVQAPPGTGRVLVVDDEETIRTFAVRALSRLGYAVTCFPDGASALEHFAQAFAKIDLVLLDLTMPGLTGEETFHRLRALDPAARIVIISGHSRQAAADALLGAGARSFLAKPFRAHELAQEVAQHVRRQPGTTAPREAG